MTAPLPPTSAYRWTAVTQDGKRSAQFEHTLLMTEDGAVPFTAKLPTSPVQPWEKKALD